jgi:hypothetical protein
MLHMFYTYVARVCSKCFTYFIFMLQQVFHVASVLSRCCICFYTYAVSVHSKCSIYFRLMLHSSIFMLQVFRVSEICLDSNRGTGQALREGAWRARCFLQTGHACSHPSSRVPPAHREDGVRDTEQLAQPGCACGAGRGSQERGMHVGRGEADRGRTCA